MDTKQPQQTPKQPLELSTTRAHMWAMQAYQECSKSADFQSLNGQPSKYATYLIDLLRATGGTPEALSPDATTEQGDWYRAVYRVGDGSVCAVYDSGVKIAPSETQVLRHPDGRFADVWDGHSVQGLQAALGNSMPRLSAEDDEEPFSLDEEAAVLPTQAALKNHPLNAIGTVVAIDQDQNTVLLMKGSELFAVPKDGAGARDVINTAINNAHAMAQDLGISPQEVLNEIQPGVRLMEEVEKTFQRLGAPRHGASPKPSEEFKAH